MGELLSKSLVVILIVLLGPTTAVLSSQDAIPGDRTYPVKRGLENVIITFASVNPQSKVFFSQDFSKRRYKETIALVKKGKTATASLSELISQTQNAAIEIERLQDINLKKEYAQNFTRQIDEYKDGLAKVQKTEVPQIVLKQPTPLPQPVVVTLPPKQTEVVPAEVIREEADPFDEASDRLEEIKVTLLAAADLPKPKPALKSSARGPGSPFVADLRKEEDSSQPAIRRGSPFGQQEKQESSNSGRGKEERD